MWSNKGSENAWGKLVRSEKYYGSDCLEVGGKGEGGIIADS